MNEKNKLKDKKDQYVTIDRNFLNYRTKIDFSNGEVINNEGTLTPRELFLYCHLHFHRCYLTDSTITSIDLLSQQVTIYTRADRNKKVIKELIKSLVAKGLISCNSNIESYSTLLDISFLNLELKKGYEHIYYSTLEKADNPEEFFVLCLIITLKREIPFSEYAARMGCSEKHVRTVINEMESKGKINIQHGKSYIDENNQPRKETNSYDIVNNRFYTTIQNEAGEETRHHNWFVKNSKLDYNDYYIYKTSSDKKLKERAEKRMTAIKSKKPDFFDVWERKYVSENPQKQSYKNNDNKTDEAISIKDNVIPIKRETINVSAARRTPTNFETMIDMNSL